MPWASIEANTEFVSPTSTGPIMLATPDYGTSNAIPVSVAAAGAYDSGLLNGDGYKILSAGATSSQAGAITIQRYLDTAGLIPQGALASSTLVAATPNTVNVTDGLPYAMFRVRLTNTGGSTATISAFMILMAAA